MISSRCSPPNGADAVQVAPPSVDVAAVTVPSGPLRMARQSPPGAHETTEDADGERCWVIRVVQCCPPSAVATIETTPVNWSTPLATHAEADSHDSERSEPVLCGITPCSHVAPPSDEEKATSSPAGRRSPRARRTRCSSGRRPRRGTAGRTGTVRGRPSAAGAPSRLRPPARWARVRGAPPLRPRSRVHAAPCSEPPSCAPFSSDSVSSTRAVAVGASEPVRAAVGDVSVGDPRAAGAPPRSRRPHRPRSR